MRISTSLLFALVSLQQLLLPKRAQAKTCVPYNIPIWDYGEGKAAAVGNDGTVLMMAPLSNASEWHHFIGPRVTFDISGYDFLSLSANARSPMDHNVTADFELWFRFKTEEKDGEYESVYVGFVELNESAGRTEVSFGLEDLSPRIRSSINALTFRRFHFANTGTAVSFSVRNMTLFCSESESIDLPTSLATTTERSEVEWSNAKRGLLRHILPDLRLGLPEFKVSSNHTALVSLLTCLFLIDNDVDYFAQSPVNNTELYSTQLIMRYIINTMRTGGTVEEIYTDRVTRSLVERYTYRTRFSTLERLRYGFSDAFGVYPVIFHQFIEARRTKTSEAFEAHAIELEIGDRRMPVRMADLFASYFGSSKTQKTINRYKYLVFDPQDVTNENSKIIPVILDRTNSNNGRFNDITVLGTDRIDISEFVHPELRVPGKKYILIFRSAILEHMTESRRDEPMYWAFLALGNEYMTWDLNESPRVQRSFGVPDEIALALTRRSVMVFYSLFQL